MGIQVPTVSLSAAQNSVGLTVIVKRGVAVPIRVEDPNQLLAKNEGTIAGAHLLICVASDALVFHEATLVSTDSKGRDYQMVIPFGATVRLVVNGGFFLLSDGLGQPLTQAASTFRAARTIDGAAA
jgi:hypothetical protein